ncbi:unnamed protein product [Cyprideis torosa]|uniref:Ferritin n=1 Tax=Cyprideis torosa TaxID=163714 RepID=A0A7R8ZGD9_9CRUS|nr:unnamed protein product [Cyprideis torosa]CAG0881446.1 unnamed protein product [Cyprideis torosa]
MHFTLNKDLEISFSYSKYGSEMNTVTLQEPFDTVADPTSYSKYGSEMNTVTLQEPFDTVADPTSTQPYNLGDCTSRHPFSFNNVAECRSLNFDTAMPLILLGAEDESVCHARDERYSDYHCMRWLRGQIENELYASLTYMKMGIFFGMDHVNRLGASKFFFESASEEREHAKKLINNH